MKKRLLTIITLTVVPFVSTAQETRIATDASSLIGGLHTVVNTQLIPLFILMALAFTIYSVVDFMAASEDSQQKEEKKQRIFWGIIGLFVIVSIWGLVAIIARSFGIFAGGTLQ